MNGKSYLLATLALCGLGTMTGCTAAGLDAVTFPTNADVKFYAGQHTKEMLEQTGTLTAQHELIKPEAAEAMRKLLEEHERKIETIGEITNAHQGSIAGLVKDALAVASNFVGINLPLKDFIDDEIETTGKDVERKIGETEARLVGAIDDVKGGFEDAIENALEEVDDEIQTALARLSDETRLKFAAVNQDTIDKLSAVRTDDAEFRRVLQQELQLTKAEMEGLKGMSIEQILAMLAAAAGAAGVGVAGGRGGKSRGQKAIDDAHRRIDKVKAELSMRSLVTPSAAATKPSN